MTLSPEHFDLADGPNKLFKSKYFCELADTEELVNYPKLEGLGRVPQSVISHLADWCSPAVQVGLVHNEDETLHPEALVVQSLAQDSLLNVISADVFSTERDADSRGRESALEAHILSGSKDSRQENDQKSKAQEYVETSNPLKQKKLKKSVQPRYALQTRSETVEVLDDGYKWRKYGQKSLKNSPHPRSYYRCAVTRCTVKKRVERSAQDSGVVITTYHGIHNHYTDADCYESQVDQAKRSNFPQLFQLWPLGEAFNHLEELRAHGLCNNSIIQ